MKYKIKKCTSGNKSYGEKSPVKIHIFLHFLRNFKVYFVSLANLKNTNKTLTAASAVCGQHTH